MLWMQKKEIQQYSNILQIGAGGCGGRCHGYISFPVIWNLSHNMIYFFAALMIITSFQKIKL